MVQTRAQTAAAAEAASSAVRSSSRLAGRKKRVKATSSGEKLTSPIGKSNSDSKKGSVRVTTRQRKASSTSSTVVSKIGVAKAKRKAASAKVKAKRNLAVERASSSSSSSMQVINVVEIADSEGDEEEVESACKEETMTIQEGGGEEESAMVCEICMENDKNAEILPCGHVEFCVTCILMVKDRSEAEGKQALCPYCMQPFEEIWERIP
eukprot:TRINITY_DN63275_c0_g1_i1.p2 TRINITY_DN63275_c0_g1~~TRINITY_DN63275_c0_g1_i1.p2  ORF type:complete len:209 (+),score=45.94 TRINITY_DN63275_c0_g1_i1:94-720(+)